MRKQRLSVQEFEKKESHNKLRKDHLNDDDDDDDDDNDDGNNDNNECHDDRDDDNDDDADDVDDGSIFLNVRRSFKSMSEGLKCVQ